MTIDAKRHYKEYIFNLQMRQDAKDKHADFENDLTKFVFEEPVPAILIALMQLSSAVIVEVLNMVMLTGQINVYKCIANFVAIKVISEIDNIYIGAVSDSTLDRIKSEGGWQPKVVYKKLAWQNRDTGNKCLYIFWRCIKTVYICFYFYFFPFLAVLFNYVSPRCTNRYNIDLQSSLLVPNTVVNSALCEAYVPINFVLDAFSKSIFY